MQIEVTKTEKVNAKWLRVHTKCSDRFQACLFDSENNEIFEQEDGYVPDFMPEQGGDYIVLDIDLKTGQITNWQSPTAEQLEAWINPDD